jgi:radical SAM/Cys-rich protein
MRDTLKLLLNTDFPNVYRGRLETLQANLGYRCNQSCFHCHVAASPKRTEEMTWETMALILRFIDEQGVRTLDLTGGAPELNPHFRKLVLAARAMGLRIIDRCNLTILNESGQEDLALFLAANEVDIIASLPCYLEENVDRQRGAGVFESSLTGLRKLNDLGYGKADSGKLLTLVFNPAGPTLPPDQLNLETDYKRELATRYGIVFNQLYALANMPIQRFGSQLVSRNEFHDYMTLLKGAHRDDNLKGVMCRTLISVSWQGHVHDCDFNQMLDLSLGDAPVALHLSALLQRDLEGMPVRIANHCYGCTAGQGSSCGGSLATKGGSRAKPMADGLRI